MTDTSEDHKGTVGIGGKTITNFCFAGDIDGLAVERLNKISTANGMDISAEKTKLVTNNTNGINKEIRINKQNLGTVTSFKVPGLSYLTKVPSLKYSPGKHRRLQHLQG